LHRPLTDYFSKKFTAPALLFLPCVLTAMELFGRVISRPATSLIASRSHGRRTSWNSFLPMLSPTATPFINEDSSFNPNALGGVRTKITRIDNEFAKTQPGGVPYYGFTYFPRPGEVDPPYEPTKLFRVRRLCTLIGKPHWDKRIMWQLGLAGKNKKQSEVVILKNTPEICQKLYLVKHLVEIAPITFSNGFPTDAHSGFLKENGEYETYSEVGEARAKNLEEETKSFETARRKELGRTTVKKRLHHKWFGRWDANI